MNVLLVEGNTLLRETIKQIIMNWQTNVLVHDYESLEDFASSSIEIKFDLIILKLEQPYCNNSNVKHIVDTVSDSPLVCLVDTADRKIVQELIQSGSKAIITGTASSDEFLAILQLVMAGGTFVPCEVFKAMNNESVVDRSHNHRSQNTLTDNYNFKSYGLSERHIEVLELLFQGYSNKAISDELCLSINTVKAHLTSIFKLLSVKSRTEALALFSQNAIPYKSTQQNRI